jgi:hypothetical protein
MKNWTIAFANGDRYRILGTTKDAFAICYERNQIPRLMIGKPIVRS